MRTITGKLTKIKNCKEGDIISLTSPIELEGVNYLNIVVTPSMIVEYKDLSDDFAFNVISLNNGRPRTFRLEENVFVFKKEDVFQ